MITRRFFVTGLSHRDWFVTCTGLVCPVATQHAYDKDLLFRLSHGDWFVTCTGLVCPVAALDAYDIAS